MRALTMNARTVLAASVCLLVLALLVPVANAAPVVTVFHVKVTLSPFSGANVTAIYCDTGTTCTGGLQIWNLGAGVALSSGQTLVLTQTGKLSDGTKTTPATTITGAPNAGNFDTSDRVNPGTVKLQDCSPTNKCRVKVEADTGAGLVVLYDDLGAGSELSKNNVDTESDGATVCEGVQFAVKFTSATGSWKMATGYADNVHTPNCDFFPSPWSGTATVFKGGGSDAQGRCTAAGTCYDAGALLFVAPGCTLTQGFWKNHGLNSPGNQENEWPVNHLTLGTVNYTQLQLQSILDEPVKGNGLISLAHQLIAAKLNIANGADPTAISSTITAADNLIGGKVVPPVGNGSLTPAQVSALVTALTNFNEGTTGPGHCSDSSETD
jgi:hypothetical protein